MCGSYWLDFEGSFRNTTVWVGGQLVATHACGYTPFRVRLDNVTALRPSGRGRGPGRAGMWMHGGVVSCAEAHAAGRGRGIFSF